MAVIHFELTASSVPNVGMIRPIETWTGSQPL